MTATPLIAMRDISKSFGAIRALKSVSFSAYGGEEIRIGDRVLAQDVETGELAYKPVLQTTIRPPNRPRPPQRPAAARASAITASAITTLTDRFRLQASELDR